jgi:hypothetical protein
MTEATQYLTAPAEPDDSVTGGFVNPVDIFNYLSPSAWVNSIIANVSGIDIFGYVTDTFTGEWAALYKFGDALNNLAQCMQQIGIDIERGVINVDQTWDGNAADSAYFYFSGLAAAVSSQQTALYDAADGYHRAARGAWELSSQLGNILQAVADKAILIGISAAIGTATAESGVGAIVGYGMAAYQMTQLLALVNKASTIANTAGSVIMGAMGGGMDAFSQGSHLTDIPVPSTPYAAPGA